jgi:hypothetical protein
MALVGLNGNDIYSEPRASWLATTGRNMRSTVVAFICCSLKGC